MLNSVEAKIFADEASLFCSRVPKLTAQASMQEVITRVAERNRQHKLTLSTEKCEVAFFTSNLHYTAVAANPHGRPATMLYPTAKAPMDHARQCTLGPMLQALLQRPPVDVV